MESAGIDVLDEDSPRAAAVALPQLVAIGAVRGAESTMSVTFVRYCGAELALAGYL